MEINQAAYQVTYDPSTATIACQGAFRLQGGAEYNPILELLIEATDAKPSLLTLDLRTLQLLNSSGINMLSKFVLQVRKHNTSQVVIKGSSQFPYSPRSMHMREDQA
jgi:hypothetical protein